MTSESAARHAPVISIRGPSDWWTGLLILSMCLLLALLSALPLDGPTPGHEALTAFLLLWSGTWFWAQAVKRSRKVELDAQAREVRLRYRTLFFRQRSQRFQADQFVAVTSYLTRGRWTDLNHLELVTPDVRAVSMAVFPVATETESPQVRDLRHRIAAHLRLNDSGFLGCRMQTPEVKAADRARLT
jgi:hypothetical protein